LFDLNFAIWNRGMNSNHLPHASTSSTSLMDTNTWLWPDSTKSPVFQHQSVQGTDGQKRTDQVELHDTHVLLPNTWCNKRMHLSWALARVL
jgi:hypothetical protein